MTQKSKRTLDAKFVENLKPPQSGVKEYWDAATPGFGLRVYAPSARAGRGTKSWCLMARIRGKQKRIKLGRYPAVKLKDARQKASDIKDAIDRGEDPTENKTTPYDEITFGSIAETYIERECSNLVRGGDLESVIRRRLLPKWKNKRFVDLRGSHAIALTDALIDAGYAAAANNLHGTIVRIGRWAKAKDMIEFSPFSDMEFPAPKVERDRVLTPAEIRALWPVWDVEGDPFGHFQKMLLLTMQRRCEVSGMKPNEIDFEKKIWTVPGTRTKNKLPVMVPLSQMALDILEEMPECEDDEFLFSTTGGEKPISGFSKNKKRTDKASKVTDWRLHDLRRTGRTGLARLRVPEVVAERVLNHVERNSLKRIYDQYGYLEEKTEAMDKWAVELTTILKHDDENIVRLEEVKAG